jgi:hypothetical protein
MLFSSLLPVAAILSGCATGPFHADAPRHAADVPTLKVVVDCGGCKVKSDLKALVAEGYNGAASQAGAKVLPSKVATLTIKEYVARDDSARFWAGAFAGKDEIKAVLSYQGKQFPVEDYARMAFKGIDNVAKNVGEKAYEQLGN